MYELKTYRGYIRNWESLCKELGISTQDREQREKEILLKGYERWGAEISSHLNGLYAFAIWDDQKKQLFAMRDPFGTKSFYYYVTKDQRLLYGGSIQEIISQDGFEKALNERSLQLYLSFTYVAGEETMYEGLKKLMPGSYLIFKDGKLEITKYWSVQYHPDNEKTLEQWADEIHSTVKELIGDNVDPGDYVESFLSGGVDSSYLAAMCDHVKVTNSASFDDPQFDESPLAAETAKVLGKENHKALVGKEEFFQAVPKVVKWLELPLGDASTIVLAIASERVHQNTQICYSGEGIDEFFGGYKIYKNAQKYGESVRTHFVGNTSIMKEEDKKRLLLRYDENTLPIRLTDEVYRYLESDDPLSWMMAVDISIWLEGDIYFAIDKIGLGTGLEIRMPFTDMRMFDIASRLPSQFKVTTDGDKIAFRHAAAKALPQEVAFRTKMGFPVPIRKWLSTDLFVEDIRRKFTSPAARKYFSETELFTLLDTFLGGEDTLWRKIWTIYIFLVWYETCFEAA